MQPTSKMFRIILIRLLLLLLLISIITVNAKRSGKKKRSRNRRPPAQPSGYPSGFNNNGGGPQGGGFNKPPPGFGYGGPGKPPPPGGPKMPSFADFQKQFPNGYKPDFDFNKPPPNFNAEKAPDGFQDWFSNYMNDHKDEFKQPPPQKPKEKKRKKNLYQILGISPRASQQEIKKSFRRLAREMHPDKVPKALKDEFQDKFIELANAYEVLSNEKKRRRYDQTGLTGDEQYEGMDDEEDFDGFGGFNSFDEAWSAFGDMGEKPADVQPDVTDSFTSWLLFSILALFIFFPIIVQSYKAKNKKKKTLKWLRKIQKLIEDQLFSFMKSFKKCWRRWTTPNEDIWTTASRIDSINKKKKKSSTGGSTPRSSNNNNNNSSQQQQVQKANKQEEQVVKEVRKKNIDDEIALHSTSSSKKSIDTKKLLNKTKKQKIYITSSSSSSSDNNNNEEVEQIKVCTFICCEYTFSCTRKKRTVTLSSDSSEEENEEDEEVITNNIMGKNTKKISAGIKNPNNKSQAKAARSFLRNRWWIEYKNVLIAILVLSISIFAATIFVNVKNEGTKLLFLKPNNGNDNNDDEGFVNAKDILVPNKVSNFSYVILCHEHDNVEIDKVWQKLVYSPELVERKLNVKGAVVNCKEKLPDGFFDDSSINFGTNERKLQGNTVAEAFQLDMNQATPISFVVSHMRKPIQLQSNVFKSKDTLPLAFQTIELAVGVPKLWAIKNNANLKKYCTNPNFAACGLILRYDNLAEDIKDVLSIIVRKYPYMNFAQVDMRKNFVSIEQKLPSRDSDTTAPHFLVLHTNGEEHQIAARAHRGFFTEPNVDAFISQTLKRLSGDSSEIKYLKDELTISKRGGRDEKKKKAKEEEKKSKLKRKKKKQQKEEKQKSKDKKKKEEKQKKEQRKKSIKQKKRENKKKFEENEKQLSKEEEVDDDGEGSDDEDEIDLDDPNNIEHAWGEQWKEFSEEE